MKLNFNVICTLSHLSCLKTIVYQPEPILHIIKNCPSGWCYSTCQSPYHSHAPSIRSHRGTKVVLPEFQPMRVPEGPVCIHLFRQNPVFTSLHLKSPVHVVPPQCRGVTRFHGNLTNWFVHSSKVVFCDTILNFSVAAFCSELLSSPRNGSERHSES